MIHRRVPSPNFDERPAPPDMIVLHYTDMADVEQAIALLASPESRVSAHYVITAKGEIVAMVDEDARAWHAGVSYWDGSRDINARAIGIELDSPGHRPDAPAFAEPQIAALLRLMGAIRSRWDIPKRGVVAHSDIAPLRKIDPGERFPWARLAREGHALHVPAETATKGDAADFWRTLAAAGYDTGEDETMRAALARAFHRRHRPTALTSAPDSLSAAIATDFLAAVDADRCGTSGRRAGLR